MCAISETLQTLDLFSSLDDSQIDEIVRNADRVVYNDGDIILAAGELCDAATVIVDGTALACAADGEGRAIVPSGSILAELAMVVEIEAQTNVIAQARVRTIRIPRETLAAQLSEDPTLAEGLIDALVSRLRGLARELAAFDIGGPVAVAADQADETFDAPVSAERPHPFDDRLGPINRLMSQVAETGPPGPLHS